ncbi:MAG: hypothetical protein OXI77_08925 [Chloroflexota bacterium]|nr:hypothetical protein [Chloroflexota bacterium]MDE2909663.1 hypothetical protein [Chloroflexota bacterium]
MAGWEQIALIIAVIAGLFLRLRSDIKRLEDKMDDGFRSVDDRLRKVETEQARMAGLLEGLGLSGKLPASEA